MYYQYSNRFANEHFEEFYEKYIELKQTEEFSKSNILKIFAEVTRNDRLFGKVSLKIDEMYLTQEEKKNLQIMQEYGLEDIDDRESLQKRLEHTISDGIQYSVSQSEYGDKKLQEIKQVLPQFEKFKEVYLRLRQVGLEDKLYENLDLKNVSYDELLQRATVIVEEKAKLEEQKKEIKPVNLEQEKKEEQTTEQQGKEVSKAKENIKINEFGEIIRPNANESLIEDENVEEAREQSKVSKKIETNLWMNRFNGWYSTIDKVSQKGRAKFVRMKSDIVKAINEEIKGKTNDRQDNTQNKVTNER